MGMQITRNYLVQQSTRGLQRKYLQGRGYDIVPESGQGFLVRLCGVLVIEDDQHVLANATFFWAQTFKPLGLQQVIIG